MKSFLVGNPSQILQQLFKVVYSLLDHNLAQKKTKKNRVTLEDTAWTLQFFLLRLIDSPNTQPILNLKLLSALQISLMSEQYEIACSKENPFLNSTDFEGKSIYNLREVVENTLNSYN